MSYKVLGQVTGALSSDYPATLYTVPASRETVVSSLTVCNRATTAASFRIAVRPAGAALAAVHYIYYDVEVQGNSTFVFTGGITLAATDVVTVDSESATSALTFSLFGKEIT